MRISPPSLTSKLDARFGKRRNCADINQIFPYKVCINLDRRVDRWCSVQERFSQHDIRNVIRFSAVDGRTQIVPAEWTSTSGAYGCLLSHLEVVRRARDHGAPSVLIFEDDVSFDEHFAGKFNDFIPQLPRDWDILYFGALHHDDPIEVTENVCRVQRAYSTFAYALNQTVFDEFIEINQQATTPVDFNNLVLQCRRECYCFKPHLAWEEGGYSDAQERSANHWYLKESLVIRGKEMDQLLNQTSVVIAHQNPDRSETVTQNLLFLARFYIERLSGIEVIVVEEDRAPTIQPSQLPQECQYLWLKADGPFSKGRCFNAGAKLAPPERKLVIFSDSDVFIEEWDICANLQMCLRYDYVSGFESMIHLTSADTRSLREDLELKLRWFNNSSYSRTRHQFSYLNTQYSDQFAGYCIFKRQSFESAGGWSEQNTRSDALMLASGNGRPLRMFASPNFALRLNGSDLGTISEENR